MKLYAKIRESGEVRQVINTYQYTDGATMQVLMRGIPSNYHLGADCDLCDEQGRLLVPEDDSHVDKVLLFAFADWIRCNGWKPDGYKTWSRMSRGTLEVENTHGLMYLYFEHNTPSEGKEEGK